MKYEVLFLVYLLCRYTINVLFNKYSIHLGDSLDEWPNDAWLNGRVSSFCACQFDALQSSKVPSLFNQLNIVRLLVERFTQF